MLSSASLEKHAGLQCSACFRGRLESMAPDSTGSSHNWHTTAKRFHMPTIRGNSSHGLACVVFLCIASIASADPQKAVVRLPSHGGSGTVIATTASHTYILSCAHAFQAEDAVKPIQIDGQQVPAGPPRLVAVDYEHDLSLIEIPAGNAPNVAPVAGPGHKPSAHLLSVGYDEMRLPATERPVHIVKTDNDITWTREPPWHGRSGGALLDLDQGVLIGVVSGYVNYPEGPGLYVSHRDIGIFLEQRHWSSPAGSMKTRGEDREAGAGRWPDPSPPMIGGFPSFPPRLSPFNCPGGG
jgi:Trypsin-like peptidase domain